MRYLVFHSRTGAAAVVAALQFLGTAEDTRVLSGLQHLLTGFSVRDEQPGLTVLALTSGKERSVLTHALRALTKQFSPDSKIDIYDLTVAEWPSCSLWVWLLRNALLPKPLGQWLVRRLIDSVQAARKEVGF